MFQPDSPGGGKPGSICFVANDFDYVMRNGGIGTYNWLMAELQARLGWRVHVLYCGEVHDSAALKKLPPFLAERGIGFSQLEDFDIPAPLEVGADSDPSYLMLSDRVRYALEQLHHQHHFDLAEFGEWGALGFRTIQAKRAGLAFPDLGTVVKLHSSTQWMREGNLRWMGHPEDLERDFCERYAFENADFQISPCHYMLEYARSIGWQVRTDAQVIAYPYPKAAYVPQGNPAPAMREIVFFGRLETRKGLEVFVNAVKKLDSAIPVTFLGRPTTLASGKFAPEFIKTKLKGRKVSLLMNLNREQALGYLAEGSRLCVMASLADNSPFTVIECAVNAIPFLASRVGGIPEIVHHPQAQAQLLFEPNDRDLHRVLKDYLAGDPAEQLALRETLRQCTRVADNNHTVAEQYHAILDCKRAESVVSTQSAAPQIPLVTIAVPFFNLGEYLPQTLASIAAQTYENLEVIVINDGSTEPNSLRAFAEMEKRYPSFRFVSQENAGIGATRNRGLFEAAGEYFIPMDADNVAYPHMVETFVRAIQHNSVASAITCFYLAFKKSRDLKDGKFAYSCRPTGGPRVMGSFRNVYGDANAIFRVQDFRAVGGYETERHTSWEDWEAFVKLVNAGYRVDVVPDYLFAYRHLASGFSRVTSLFQNHQRVMRQFYQAKDLPVAEQMALWTALVSFKQCYDDLARENKGMRIRIRAIRYRVADALHAVVASVPFLKWGIRGLMRGGWKTWKMLAGKMRK